SERGTWSEIDRDFVVIGDFHAAAEKAIIHHYMDDVFVCAPSEDLLAHTLDLTVDALIAAGFELQESKIQWVPSWKYLGLEIAPDHILTKMRIPKAVRILQLLLLASFQTPAGGQATLLPKMSLSHVTDNIHQNISNVVSKAEKNLKDWLNDLLLDWGFPEWTDFLVKAGLLMLFVIVVVLIAFCVIKCMVRKIIRKLIPNHTASPQINRVAMPTDPEDEDEPEEFISLEVDEDEILPPERYWPYPIEEWSTDHEWDEISYFRSGSPSPQMQDTSY
ncbi:hypothetical protein HGM15179_020625, partial [Zosterops borbonicus]